MKWKNYYKALMVCSMIALLLTGGVIFYENKNNNTGTEEVATEMASKEYKKVAITFDDGPHPRYTAELLDGLKERGVPAAFFVIGRNIEGNEDLIKRMKEEGHEIGNHTYDHVNITIISNEEAEEQIGKTNELIYEITGDYPAYIRTPFGCENNDLECGKDMLMVKWDIDSLDWTTKNPDEIVQRVVTKVDDNGIILLHDWYGSSVKAALRIIDILQAEGYEFVTIDELVLD